MEKLKYIARMNGCLVFDYSKSQQILILCDLFEEAKHAEAVTCIDTCGNKLIFIDDTLPEEQQLFALAHELGHIILQHGYKNSNMSQEKDADFFADIFLRLGAAV